jgi:hypothetical protein
MRGGWGWCPGCGRERRAGAVMGHHNRWDWPERRMVPCEGAGKVPCDSAREAWSAAPRTVWCDHDTRAVTYELDQTRTDRRRLRVAQ